MEKSTENQFFENALKMIQDLLNQNLEILDDESKEAVQHYLDHDEYEMAFEGLFIDLMSVNKLISNKNLDSYVDLGKQLHLYPV